MEERLRLSLETWLHEYGLDDVEAHRLAGVLAFRLLDRELWFLVDYGNEVHKIVEIEYEDSYDDCLGWKVWTERNEENDCE